MLESLFMSGIVLDITSEIGKRVVLTRSRYNHICQRHPEVFGVIEKMVETLVSPQTIRRSTYDEAVWLFYRFFETTPVTEKYLMVAVRILNNEGFVVTSYFTDRVKIGEEIWRER